MIDDLELQLQAELRALFDVDTQTYLQNYIAKVLQLNPQSWKEDIQEIYRAIHTIKGGAVTVGADPILYVAIALEDLLSDLRYLETAPPLEDGQLIQGLNEAGELLASTLDIEGIGEEAKKKVQPTVDRIEEFRHEIQSKYLPNWSQNQTLHLEFAQQGFDLVVLDLEMAIEQLKEGEPVPEKTLETAQVTLTQLRDIGRDLQFSSGWSQLIYGYRKLLNVPDAKVWISEWPKYFKELKACAMNGGKIVTNATENELVEPSATPVEQEIDLNNEMAFNLPELEADLSDQLADLQLINEINLPLEEDSFHEDLVLDLSRLSQGLEQLEALTDDFSEEIVLESRPQWFGSAHQPLENTLLDLDLGQISQAIEDLQESQPDQLIPLTDTGKTVLDFSWDDMETEENEWVETPEREKEPDVSEQSQTVVSSPLEKVIVPPPIKTEENNIQIPVSLSRANQTSQHLVEVLLSARSCSGLYQGLQSQLGKLFALATESVNYITRLRQIQDDYALLNDLETASHTTGISLERYRQGYTTINRLLEIALRLSELGAEAEKVSVATQESFQSLERNILDLEQSISVSRVIPFKTMAFRARAIVRDLINRYGKPAQLVVIGEEIELDAEITAKLEPALLHLLRNAYDHGLEEADNRSHAGKPKQGTITLSLQRRGNQYLLMVADDGGGIDAKAIAKMAREKKLPLNQTETPEKLLSVLCQPGFSSRQSVGEVSGRGVGMDVVSSQIARLGGSLGLETRLGQGTAFKIQFPTPRLLVPCVLLTRGDRTFAIPLENVITTSLWESLKVEENPGKVGHFSIEMSDSGEKLPGLDLLEYWLGGDTFYPKGETAIGVYVGKVNHARIWLLADDLGDTVEVLINPLPKPLVPPAGLLGVSLQIDGTLIPVIDGEALADYLTSADLALNLEENREIRQEDSTSETILVVDDAALMRRRIEASLTAYGYRVQTCGDGLEAWNWLQSHPTPALMITDLEMPNMDGFTLIGRLRDQGTRMNVLVISSRLSEEWNREAQRIGANDFLTKGFSTQELISKVNALVSVAV